MSRNGRPGHLPESCRSVETWGRGCCTSRFGFSQRLSQSSTRHAKSSCSVLGKAQLKKVYKGSLKPQG